MSSSSARNGKVPAASSSWTDSSPLTIVSRSDAGEAGLEPGAHAERALRENSHHLPRLKHVQRAAERAHVGPLQVDGNRADVAVEHRMERRRTPDTGHH